MKHSPRVAGSEELEAESDALVFWRSTGSAVELHDRREGGYTLQLRRLCPGTRPEGAGLGAEAMRRRSAAPALRRRRAALIDPLADGDSARTWLRLLGGEPALQSRR